MFLILPLLIALVSLLAMAFVVYRKMPYLRKLAPESHPAGQTIVHEYAPEVVDWAVSIPWRQYMRNALVEIEKLLRKGRLLMSAIDRASDTIIRKVRRVHIETAKQHEAIVAHRQEEEARLAEEPDEIDLDDPDQLRQEEQRLIVAIAQNPKDVEQIIRLARVYMRLQAYADAIEAFEAAAKLLPDEASIQKRLKRARELRQQQLSAQAPESL